MLSSNNVLATVTTKRVTAENTEAMPTSADNMTDGAHKFVTEDGQALGIIKEGKNYYIYDYESGNISFAQSKADINKLLSDVQKQRGARDVLAAVPMDTNVSSTTDGKENSVSDGKADAKTSRIDATNPKKIHEYLRENVKGYKALSEPNQAMVRAIIRQGRLLGIPDADLLLYAKVATRSSMNIVFDKKATYLGKDGKTGKDVYADGFYQRSQNRIVVNPEGSRSAERLLIHELTHAIFKTPSGTIILMNGVKNLSQDEKDRITENYSKLHKNSSGGEISLKIMDEQQAHYAEWALRDRAILEKLVSDKPKLKDMILDFFTKAKSDYAGEDKLDAAAKKLYRQYKKLFDEFSARNADTNAVERTVRGNDKEYAFTDSKTGRANDKLSGYDDELRRLIEDRGDYIVDTYDKLTEVVDLAFDNTSHKATAYFGIVDAQTLEKIKNSVPNLPVYSKDTLFKNDRGYSIAVTLDSIKHLTDEKGLSQDDVVDYLNRLADTIVEFDGVSFGYYEKGNNKSNGLLFKKKFSDGTLVSFDIVSNKKRSLSMQTLYLEKGDYQKKKFAKTLPMDNPRGHTSETRAGQTSNNSIAKSLYFVNPLT